MAWNYKQIKINGKTMLEHRYVMECHIGRKLDSSECVHHRNGNQRDNRLSNLVLIKNGEHTKLHHPKKRFVKLKCNNCGLEFFRSYNCRPAVKKNNKSYCCRKCVYESQSKC